MKALYEVERNVVSTTAIRLEPDPPLAEIGTNNSLYLITVNEDGSQTCEIVDGQVEEKMQATKMIYNDEFGQSH